MLKVHKMKGPVIQKTIANKTYSHVTGRNDGLHSGSLVNLLAVGSQVRFSLRVFFCDFTAESDFLVSKQEKRGGVAEPFSH